MTVLIGHDLYGSDMIQKNFSDYTECCAWCQSYNGCVAYTWGLSTAGVYAYECFLKNAIPTSSVNSVLVSAHY